MIAGRLFIEHLPDGSWRGSTPYLPGYSIGSATEEEARKVVEDAISAYTVSMAPVDVCPPSGVPLAPAAPIPPARKADGSIPVYFGLPDPRLFDPGQEATFEGWVPADRVSQKLVRCLEGIRDVEVYLELTKPARWDSADKRKIKALAPPLYNLAIALRDLFSFVVSNKGTAKGLGAHRLKELCARKREFEQSVPLTRGAPLRCVRDKISAHLDEEAVAHPEGFWEKVDGPTYLRWLKECLNHLVFLIDLGLYTWTRKGGHPNLWTMMFSDGMATNLLVEEGRTPYVLNCMLMRSPLYGILGEVQGVACGWNELARRCGLQDELITWSI